MSPAYVDVKKAFDEAENMGLIPDRKVALIPGWVLLQSCNYVLVYPKARVDLIKEHDSSIIQGHTVIDTVRAPLSLDGFVIC